MVVRIVRPFREETFDDRSLKCARAAIAMRAQSNYEYQEETNIVIRSISTRSD